MDDIRARREALGLSRQQLADLASTTPSGVWSVENGKNPRGGDAVKRQVLEALERREGGAGNTNDTAESAAKAAKAAKAREKVGADLAVVHPDWQIAYTWNGLNVNDEVNVSGDAGKYTFLKYVVTTAGNEWVDVFGGKGGRKKVRAFDPSRVTPARRTARRRGPGEDVDKKSSWKVTLGDNTLEFATYADANHQVQTYEIPNLKPGQTVRIINPLGTVITEVTG